MNVKLVAALGIAAIATSVLLFSFSGQTVAATMVGHETLSTGEHLVGTSDSCTYFSDPTEPELTGILVFDDLNGNAIHDHTTNPATAEPAACVMS